MAGRVQQTPSGETRSRCRCADNEDEEQTLDRRRSVEPSAQPSAQDHEAAEALAFNRKPQGEPCRRKVPCHLQHCTIWVDV